MTTRSVQQVKALFNRWRRAFAMALFGITSVLIAAYFLFGGANDGKSGGGNTALRIAIIYALHGGYGFFNWRAVKRAYLTGKTADEAMAVRL